MLQLRPHVKLLDKFGGSCVFCVHQGNIILNENVHPILYLMALQNVACATDIHCHDGALCHQLCVLLFCAC